MSESNNAGNRDELLRVRHVLAENYIVLLAVLAILVTVGGGASFTVFLDPGTQTEDRTVSTWTRTAEFTHGGEVTAENPVYTVGTQLSERQVYFPPLTPILSGEYRTSFTASSEASVDATTELTLVVRGVEDGAVLWQSTAPIGTERIEDAGPSRSIQIAYDFNLSREQQRVEQIDSVLGRTPGDAEVTVRADTRVSGEINGRPVGGRYTDTLRFVPDGDSFRVTDPGDITDRTRQTQTVTVEREYSTAWKIGSVFLFVGGIGGLGGALYARRHALLTLTRRERDDLIEQEYSEWISYGSLPSTFDPSDDDLVRVDSLSGLIDLAADNDTRVIFDDETDCYVVLDTAHTHIYRRVGSATTAIGPDQGDRAAQPEDGETSAWSDDSTPPDDSP